MIYTLNVNFYKNCIMKYSNLQLILFFNCGSWVYRNACALAAFIIFAESKWAYVCVCVCVKLYTCVRVSLLADKSLIGADTRFACVYLSEHFLLVPGHSSIVRWACVVGCKLSLNCLLLNRVSRSTLLFSLLLNYLEISLLCHFSPLFSVNLFICNLLQSKIELIHIITFS